MRRHEHGGLVLVIKQPHNKDKPNTAPGVTGPASLSVSLGPIRAPRGRVRGPKGGRQIDQVCRAPKPVRMDASVPAHIVILRCVQELLRSKRRSKRRANGAPSRRLRIPRSSSPCSEPKRILRRLLPRCLPSSDGLTAEGKRTFALRSAAFQASIKGLTRTRVSLPFGLFSNKLSESMHPPPPTEETDCMSVRTDCVNQIL